MRPAVLKPHLPIPLRSIFSGDVIRPKTVNAFKRLIYSVGSVLPLDNSSN